MEITPGMKNEWVRVEQKRLTREARRREFFARIGNGARRIFVYLFVATVFVFAFNHRVEIQGVALAKLHAALKKSYAPNKLHQGTINYQKELDDITK